MTADAHVLHGDIPQDKREMVLKVCLVVVDYVRCSRCSSYRLLRPINCQIYVTLHYTPRLSMHLADALGRCFATCDEVNR